ncbi:MAG: TetR/AcrR family transcriptional repressor of nem operon [Pseudohongiellaceae bacterium]
MTDRKTELLTLAEELLQTRGYSGFSYADLAGASGISKAAVHHHFPTKESLGLALCDGYLQQLRGVHQAIDEQAAGAFEALEMLIQAGRELLVECGKVCPSGIFEVELSILPESLKVAARHLDENMHDWMTGLLARARSQNQLHFEGAPADQAWMVMATLQGAFQKARSMGPEVYQVISKQLLLSMAPKSA